MNEDLVQAWRESRRRMYPEQTLMAFADVLAELPSDEVRAAYEAISPWALLVYVPEYSSRVFPEDFLAAARLSPSTALSFAVEQLAQMDRPLLAECVRRSPQKALSHGATLAAVAPDLLLAAAMMDPQAALNEVSTETLMDYPALLVAIFDSSTSPTYGQ